METNKIFTSTNKILVSQNKIVIGYYYPEEQIIIHTWDTNVFYLDLFKSYYQDVMVFSETNLMKGSFNDARNSKTTFTAANSWINTVLIPHLYKNGLLCWCLVTKDVFTKFAGNTLLALHSNKLVKGKLFTDAEEGMTWMKKIINESDSKKTVVDIDHNFI